MSSFALSPFQGVNVILDFSYYIITYSFLYPQPLFLFLSIYTQTSPPLEGTLGLAVVLVQIAGSNASVAGICPSVHQHSYRAQVPKYRAAGLFCLTVHPSFAGWGEGTVHPIGLLGILKQRFKNRVSVSWDSSLLLALVTVVLVLRQVGERQLN